MLMSMSREIKAQYIFEKETSALRFPQYQDGSFSSNVKLGFYGYLSLLRNRSTAYILTYPDEEIDLIYLTALLVRVAIGSLTMFFQVRWLFLVAKLAS